MAEIIINTIIGLADGLTQYEVVEQLVELNSPSITGIEYRLEMFNTDDEVREQEIEAYLTIQKETGWAHYLSVPEDFIIGNQINPKFAEHLQFAKRLNCKNIKLTIGNHEAVADIDYQTVKQWLEEAQMTLSLENDQSQTTGFADTVKEVLDIMHQKDFNVGHTFDIGNWYIAGESMAYAFKRLKDDITYLHIKNIHEDHSTSLFSDGLADVPAYFGNYPAVIEYVMPRSIWEDEIRQVAEAFN